MALAESEMDLGLPVTAKQVDELPKEARDYVLFIEQRVGCPIKYVSVGAEREALIIR